MEILAEPGFNIPLAALLLYRKPRGGFVPAELHLAVLIVLPRLSFSTLTAGLSQDVWQYSYRPLD